MKVLLKQSIELYGARYSVGLRDIPEGHCCGRDWDWAVNAGYAELIDKPVAVVAEPEAVVEAVVVADEPISETVEAVAEVQAEPEAVVEVEVKHGKKK